MVELKKHRVEAGHYELDDPVSMCTVAAVIRRADGVWKRWPSHFSPDWLVLDDLRFDTLGQAVDYTRAEYSEQLAVMNYNRRNR